MRYVIDCSTAVKWEVPEPDSPKAIRLRDDFRNGVHELLAPDIFPIEVANALYSAECKGRIAGPFATNLADILRFGPVLDQATALLPRACGIIRHAAGTRMGIYDCLYVALAKREGCALMTSDLRLRNALGATRPFIVPLASLP